ncbi:helix-turn-helix domain-containing protein [Anaerocolumna sp. AGMB13025]|uniref:helix-turn-helix domain-containing protein n=1 Tax=Anaerocolumna sp. AGMB13025 TaxID=3039116 RepID=UPI00241FA2CE|nr:helix-turn-helix domain-containing protein [Anaerocolumna sp. AGMB13025]WFR59183.1 helix-turn-helix domain-containing protein [Anaerocolumna sp. AGMB13025]
MTKQAELKQQAYASSLKSRALSVLIYLIDRSNKDLTCFPAIPTMAEQLHISVSTVKRALKELTDAGYIQKEARFRERNRGQSSNLYILLFVEQTSEPEKENSSAEADRDHIDIHTSQELSKSDTVRYITFNMLAENNKVIQKQSQKEITNEEKGFYRFEDRPMMSDLCTSVQASAPPKPTKLQGTYGGKARTDSLTVCRVSLYRWTGVESILRPP